MTEIEELETRIQNLTREDFVKLRDQFYQLDDEIQDQQIRSDFKAVKLDRLIEKARNEFSQGKAGKL